MGGLGLNWSKTERGGGGRCRFGLKKGALAIGWLANRWVALGKQEGGRAMPLGLDEFIAWASFLACVIRESIQLASIALQGEYAGDFIF